MDQKFPDHESFYEKIPHRKKIQENIAFSQPELRLLLGFTIKTILVPESLSWNVLSNKYNLEYLNINTGIHDNLMWGPFLERKGPGNFSSFHEFGSCHSLC